MFRVTIVLVLIAAAPSSQSAQPGQDPSGQAVPGQSKRRVITAEIAAAAAEVDRLLQRSWEQAGISPASQSSDAEFCRRVWLDLNGVAPPPADVRSFLYSNASDKRARLIDERLHSPRFATHFANLWTDILLPFDQRVVLGDGAAALHEWLRQHFLNDARYDALVHGFLTARGADNAGPGAFYSSRELQPEKLAAATSKIFLGVQLQCAQCHDHPFDRWTQQDFWQYAAFFARVRQDSGPMGGNVIEEALSGEVTLPNSDTIISPRYPGIEEPPERDPEDNRRRQLTVWMASRDNPYLARAAVNRVWGQLFGRGLVDPVDAMDIANQPSHPELLDFLSEFLIEQRFELRQVIAAITNTAAYGATSQVEAESRPPADSFAAMNVKTLTARQVFDSLQQNVLRQSSRSRDAMNPSSRDAQAQFLARMRVPERSPQDYSHGVVQVLGMMNGPEVSAATSAKPTGLLAAIEAPYLDDKQRIDQLFLATLSRYPNADETKMFGNSVEQVKSADQRRQVWGDLLWSLLNTAEAAVVP